MQVPFWANLLYLVAAVLFIFGIKGMTHPRTAVRGNLTSAVGMLLAVVVTLASGAIEVSLEWWMIIVGLIVGGAIGATLAIVVEMTGMPQLVAVFNGFGGGASIFVAWANVVGKDDPGVTAMIAAAAAGLIGTVTLLGSFMAFGKLQGYKAIEGNVTVPGHQAINAVLFLAAIGVGVWLVLAPAAGPAGSLPVVVSLLNSYSGLAAAATGFVLPNNMLIVAGSLVGAAGLILTAIMCKAMNRSLVNVLFGRIEAESAGSTADEVYGGRIKSTTAEELAMLLSDARRVAIVPGYGMAVAQAQHAVRDLYQTLTASEVNVDFAIHPVAGRMPGHMNVLLAEVDIPYDRLVEMEQINPQLEQVDVAIVIGANDVVNPDAREDPNSPIAGMPIIDVDQARTVVVIKRSLSPGFAGIPNPLFARDNTLMFFADGKDAVMEINSALKES